jgi:hypothetical protein
MRLNERGIKKRFLRIHPKVVTLNVFIEVHSLGIDPKRVNDIGKVTPNKKLSYRSYL